MMDKRPFTVVMLVPTGVGAEIGGYAGDAAPAANLLASICDTLIVNPNVVNGAAFMEAASNILYVEGAAIDELMQGKIGLQPVRSNRVGIIIDGAARSREDLLAPLINAMNAVRANSGVDILGYTYTRKPIGGRCLISPSGGSQGTLEDPETLLEAAQRLMERGAQAIAIFSLIENPPANEETLYRQGKGIDPIGGIEAILSHLIVKKFRLPAAHAPIFDSETGEGRRETGGGEGENRVLRQAQEGETETDRQSAIRNPQSEFKGPNTLHTSRPDPRAAAEELESTYVPCVLKGLARAPRLSQNEGLGVNDIDALVLSNGAIGGVAALEALRRQIPVIVVEENRTVLSVTAEKLKMEDRIIRARNYLEAAGILSCMRSGISWKLVRRPIPPLQEI